MPFFLFQLPERHSMFLEEPDELFAGDTAILAAGDAVATSIDRNQTTWTPSGRDLTDLRDLSGGETFFMAGTPDCYC